MGVTRQSLIKLWLAEKAGPADCGRKPPRFVKVSRMSTVDPYLSVTKVRYRVAVRRHHVTCPSVQRTASNHLQAPCPQ